MSTPTPGAEADGTGDYADLAGLHHVTAITGDASSNVAFYTEALGMRLVKKTVNQDDVSAYHLFYADQAGRAGTDVTFFDWPFATPNRPGAGTIDAIALRVPDGSLDWWIARFGRLGIPHELAPPRDGHRVLAFSDPEGQRLELAGDDGAKLAPGIPWGDGPVPREVGIRGLHGVTTTVAKLDSTAWVLREVMGFRRLPDEEAPGEDLERVAIFETGPGGPGTVLRVRVPKRPAPGRPGRGGVHHVAFRTASLERQKAWHDRIEDAGLAVTPLIDRFYFSSIYFREPGGVLYEIATDGPGFAADEPMERLGETLALPPFLESRRSEIEAGLHPIEAARGRYT